MFTFGQRLKLLSLFTLWVLIIQFWLILNALRTSSTPLYHFLTLKLFFLHRCQSLISIFQSVYFRINLFDRLRFKQFLEKFKDIHIGKSVLDCHCLLFFYIFGSLGSTPTSFFLRLLIRLIHKLLFWWFLYTFLPTIFTTFRPPSATVINWTTKHRHMYTSAEWNQCIGNTRNHQSYPARAKYWIREWISWFVPQLG